MALTGNDEFCFPQNIEVEEKYNSLFPVEPVTNCFVIFPNSKNRTKKCENNATSAGITKLIYRDFKVHDLIT